MQKFIIRIAMIGGISLSMPTLSSPIADLKINGKIIPPTCLINGITQSDIIFNYGRISPSMIPESSNYLYPADKVKNTVSIECDAETYLTFIASDTYATSILPVNNTSAWFHLVDSKNIDKAVGATFFMWESASVDGKNAYISRANDVSITGIAYQNVLYKGPTNGWTSIAQSSVNKESLSLLSGKLFKVDFRQGDVAGNQTFILSKQLLASNGIDISNGLDFLGEAVLNFSFGI